MKQTIKKTAKKLLSFSGVIKNPAEDKTLDVAGIRLAINLADGGGRLYQGRGSVEEARNQLYSRLAEKFRPDIVVDVGANYGFTAAVFAQHFQEAELILIEPDPNLSSYIEKNMKLNRISRYRLLQSICSDETVNEVPFGINPSGSQDNRVKPAEGWKEVKVSSVTITDILSAHRNTSVFIKIDTQGFETQVFKGAEGYLTSSDNWFVKSEFAPQWLESQGNSPEELLHYLVSRYRVVEGPARTRYNRDSLREIFESPLARDEVGAFVEHVRNLNSNKKGWVDLYIAPKAASKALE